MKRVLIYGVHTVNLGDDLFYKVLLERYPNDRFYMYAPEKYKSMYKQYGNCRIVSETGFGIKVIGVLCKLLHLPVTPVVYALLLFRYRINVFLVVGGSLLMEGDSNLCGILRKMNIIRKIKSNLKVLVMGTNFGPCKTDKFCREVADALVLADDVCFRDKPSYNEFKHLPNVRWGNDIVLHMQHNNNRTNKNVICVNVKSVADWPELIPYRNEYLLKTAMIVDDFSKMGGKIILLSFCEQYGDQEDTNLLYDLIEDKTNVEKYYYSGDFDKVIEIISTSEYIIATRFHAIILGLLFGLKVLPISYSTKSESMLKTYGLWKEFYDYIQYSQTEVKQLENGFVQNFEVDVGNNNQFKYLDGILHPK